MGCFWQISWVKWIKFDLFDHLKWTSSTDYSNIKFCWSSLMSYINMETCLLGTASTVAIKLLFTILKLGLLEWAKEVVFEIFGRIIRKSRIATKRLIFKKAPSKWSLLPRGWFLKKHLRNGPLSKSRWFFMILIFDKNSEFYAKQNK